MIIRLFAFLLGLFFFTVILAMGQASWTPDFSGNPVFIPQGAPLTPLCQPQIDPSCIGQWSGQAVPLTVYPPAGTAPQFQYFLPAFIPEALTLENPEEDEDWELWTPSFSSSYTRRKRERRERRAEEEREKEVPPVKRTFYRSPSDPNKVLAVEVDEQGNKIIREKEGTFSPGEDTTKWKKSEQNPEIDKKWRPWIPPKAKPKDKPAPSESPKPQDTKETAPPLDKALPAITEDKKVKGHAARKKPAVPSVERTFYRSRLNPGRVRVSETNADGQTTTREGTVKFVSAEDITQNEQGEFETKRKTRALPATTKEVKPGCFVIDKPEEKTEAGFCFTCTKDEEEDTVLSTLIKSSSSFSKSLIQYFKQVNSKSKQRFKSQVSSSDSAVQKICAPQKSLKAIINNFNNTCPKPYEGNFDKFFKKAYCKSCQKGIPPEVMMAMMSIESAGRCEARNTRGEYSLGLFQIDSTQHICRRGYTKNTEANRQCLKDPVNNMSKGMDILSDYYKDLNVIKNPDSSSCLAWTKMGAKERDGWKKAVSAYNGGPGWINRAIISAYDKETLNNTEFLVGQQGKEKWDEKLMKKDIPWETLRAYFFIESLSPGNKKKWVDKETGELKGTGRLIRNTISNLAHTEAVLGRDVQSSSPSMVEIWSQYTSQFLKKNKKPCAK